MGKPTPAAWLEDWGKLTWLAGVSGMLSVVPSTSLTERPFHNQPADAKESVTAPLWRTKLCTMPRGRRWRARQYAPVAVLHLRSPLPTRSITWRLTVCWHEPSALSVWAMNSDSVSVGAYSRSRWGGKCWSTASCIWGPHSRLKKS